MCFIVDYYKWPYWKASSQDEAWDILADADT